MNSVISLKLAPGLSRPTELTGVRSLRLVLLLVLSFCSYLFFSHLVVTAVEVRGSSMWPTLLPGDRLMLNRLTYLHRTPVRGELVVLKDPQTAELVVKRIIGLPGETIQADADNAYVNGTRLNEPYLSRAAKLSLAPHSRILVVPAEHYYVLGDNRHNSVDSRVFGPVPRENIVGVIKL